MSIQGHDCHPRKPRPRIKSRMIGRRSPRRGSTRRISIAQLRPLLGGRRRSVAALATASVLSGLAEAGVLAVVAQVAASLVDGATHVDATIGPIQIHTTVGVLLAAAAGLAALRLVLQAPISYLPARIAADVQAELRDGLFEAFTRASWAVQSRDREGHLQEMMTSQVVQASEGALQATILISSLFTFSVSDRVGSGAQRRRRRCRPRRSGSFVWSSAAD